MYTCNPNTGASSPASLAELVSPRPMRVPVTKNKVDRSEELDTQGCPLDRVHVGTHTHSHTYTYTVTHDRHTHRHTHRVTEFCSGLPQAQGNPPPSVTAGIMSFLHSKLIPSIVSRIPVLCCLLRLAPRCFQVGFLRGNT